MIRFLLAWAGAWWLVVEIVPTKLPNYMLPAYPALAILAALWLLAPKEDQEQAGMAALAAFIAALQFLVGLIGGDRRAARCCRNIMASRRPPADDWPLLAAAGAGGLCGLAALIIFLTGRRLMALIPALARRAHYYSTADRLCRPAPGPALGQRAAGRVCRKRSPRFRSAAHAGGL